MNNENIPILDSAIERSNEQQAAPVKEAPGRRNQFQKTDDPKTAQFTGRATASEAERIKDALAVRKRGDEPYDVVRFCLDMMDHIESDFLQTFKTKKKR